MPSAKSPPAGRVVAASPSSASRASSASPVFAAASTNSKRAHIVELERELELIKIDPDWFKREDAESRIIHGTRNVE